MLRLQQRRAPRSYPLTRQPSATPARPRSSGVESRRIGSDRAHLPAGMVRGDGGIREGSGPQSPPVDRRGRLLLGERTERLRKPGHTTGHAVRVSVMLLQKLSTLAMAATTVSVTTCGGLDEGMNSPAPSAISENIGLHAPHWSTEGVLAMRRWPGIEGQDFPADLRIPHVDYGTVHR